jgi:hypothetical protein
MRKLILAFALYSVVVIYMPNPAPGVDYGPITIVVPDPPMNPAPKLPAPGDKK